MKTALDRVSPAPELLLTDAVELYGIDILKALIGRQPEHIHSGGVNSRKVTGDRLLIEADKNIPLWFSKHKGYGTRQHIDAIKNTAFVRYIE